MGRFFGAEILGTIKFSVLPHSLSISLEYSHVGRNTSGKRVTNSGKNARKHASGGVLPAVFLDSASLPEQASLPDTLPGYI